MNRVLSGLTLCLVASAATARDLPGIPPGAYTISILAPVIDPSLTIDEQTIKICYTLADARAHANPVMPAAERAGCDSSDKRDGNVLAYDSSCKDGLHDLHLTQIGPDAWTGKYLYVDNAKPPMQLEPAINLHRDGDCE